MKDAQKPDHISLSKLISNIRDGQYEIPDFQREFVWKPSAIRDLMRSIFLDYYIGLFRAHGGRVGVASGIATAWHVTGVERVWRQAGLRSVTALIGR